MKMEWWTGKPSAMTDNRTQLRRLLILEVCLAFGGITLVSCLYFQVIGRQQEITEELFQHPFAVSNAGLEFRSDVLELRKYMLETILSRKELGDAELAKIALLEDHLDRHFEVIRREFLGDRARVNDIKREMDTWKRIREPIKARLNAGNPDGALVLAMQQASPPIEQILVDTDYVISFAQSMGLRFVEEGRARVIQARLFLILLASLSMAGYFLLANKLRQRIYQLYDREEYNATFDELSGAYNRRSFVRLGEGEIKRSRRHGHPLSLLMMDLDHFKTVNDAHGHDAGDSVLRQFGSICHQNLREEDFLGRMGGEEFAILLPYTDSPGALEVAERIRKDVAERDYMVTKEKYLNVTVSIGVACIDGGMTTMETLMKRADEAMYRAKHGGRNLVTAWPADGDEAKRGENVAC
ncbi:MAG: GGDEF domain-containing protein [Desulfuromonadales bacterium]|nr:GGDEF domain-containing protein [Desulfuromonadales bacterium]